MQDSNTFNDDKILDSGKAIALGRLLAIDPGTKRSGIAVSDESHIVIRPLNTITMSSWKSFLSEIRAIVEEFDAGALIIGLPLNSDGTESEMSEYARHMAKKFSLSLPIPVFLQDERVSTWEARRRVWIDTRRKAAADRVDTVAAVIILEDFIDRLNSSETRPQSV